MSKKQLGKNRFKWFAVVIFGIIILEYFTGLLGQYLSDDLKNQHIQYIERNLGFVEDKAYIMVFSAILFLLLLPYWTYQQVNYPKLPILPSDKMRKKYIHYLKNRYQNRYNHKVKEQISIKLRLIHDQTGSNKNALETYFKTTNQTISTSEKLYNILKIQQHLLLTGEIGAGKSTLLIGLAQEIMANEPNAIPIIIELGAWSPYRNKTFMEWLIEHIVKSYGFSKDYATQAIDNKWIIPIFDGMEEVQQHNPRSASLREECLKKVVRFIKEKNIPRSVISGLPNEYTALKYTSMIIDAATRAEIVVSPLSDIQIETEVRKIQTTKNILPLLHSNPSLKKVLDTPFYLKIAETVFQSNDTSIELPRTETTIKTFLLKTFVHQKINETPNENNFQAAESLQYLSFLAHLMNNESNVLFELTDLKSSDLKNRSHFRWIQYIFVFIIFSLSTLCFSALFDWEYSLTFAITFGTLLILVAIFDQPKAAAKKIKTSSYNSQIKWTKFLLWQSWRFAILYGFLGSFWILLEELGDKDIFNTFFIIFLPLLALLLLVSVFTVFPLRILQTPYHKLKSNWFWSFIYFFLFLIFYVLIIHDYNWTTVIMLFYLVMISLIIGLVQENYTNYTLLRWSFYYQKQLPLHFVDFLDYATDADLLEKDGGVHWRFRHKTLQDYFAKL